MKIIQKSRKKNMTQYEIIWTCRHGLNLLADFYKFAYFRGSPGRAQEKPGRPKIMWKSKGSRDFWENVNNPAERSQSVKPLILKKDGTFAKIGGSRHFQKNADNPAEHSKSGNTLIFKKDGTFGKSYTNHINHMKSYKNHTKSYKIIWNLMKSYDNLA